MPEIWTGTFEGAGLYPGIPEDDYHADIVPDGSLSVSGAKLLLPPNCPAIYDWQRKHPLRTKAMDLGTTVHGLVLGTGPDIAVLDYPDRRTKQYKEDEAAAIAASKVPMLAKDYREAEAIARAVTEHDTAGALLDGVDAEVSMFWTCPDTGIWLRGRMDGHTQFYGMPAVVDLKTTADASPAGFRKSLAKYGYYMQGPWYRQGLAACLGCSPDDVDFVFIVIPTVPPYLPMLYRLTPSDDERGQLQGRKAREIYRDCTETGEWPSWSDQIEDLAMPAYDRTRIDKELAEDGYRISTIDLPF